MSDVSAFCPDVVTRRHLSRIRKLVQDAGYDVTPADDYLLGAFANSAGRLEQLTRAVSEAEGDDNILRLLTAERHARADLLRFIDALQRHYAGVDAEEDTGQLRTGTDDSVLEFSPARSAVGQRIVAAVSRSTSGLTREALQKRVPGSKAAFLRGLKECVSDGSIRRTGAGRRGSPHRYWSV